jgi:hypothetical protein
MRLGLAFSALALFLTFAVPTAVAESLSQEQIRRYLVRGVGRDAPDNEIKIERWKGEVRIFLSPFSSALNPSPSIADYLSELSKYTGLTIRVVFREDEANLLINELPNESDREIALEWYLRGQERADEIKTAMQKNLPVMFKMNCFYMTVYDDDHIARALVQSSPNEGRKNDACTRKMLFRSMGVYGDPVGTPSILSIGKTELTEADKSILEIVYDKELPRGATLDALLSKY